MGIRVVEIKTCKTCEHETPVTGTAADLVCEECGCDECCKDVEKAISLELLLLNQPDISFRICKDCLKKALEMLE